MESRIQGFFSAMVRTQQWSCLCKYNEASVRRLPLGLKKFGGNIEVVSLLSGTMENQKTGW